jgi:hypothetical protein
MNGVLGSCCHIDVFFGDVCASDTLSIVFLCLVFVTCLCSAHSAH